VTNHFSLVFLGSSGAGLQLFEGLESNGKYSLLILSRRIQSTAKFAKIQTMYIPKSRTAYKLYLLISFWPIILKLREIPKGGKVLFPMINPYDFNFFFVMTFLRRDLKSYVIIHDAVPHVGSLWPPVLVTRFILKRATKIITLTNFTSELLHNKYKFTREIEKIEHPILFDVNLRNFEIDLPEEYVVLIGRIQRYKGIDEFIKLYKSIPPPDASLLIAGSGRVKRDYREKGVSVINRWLTDSEFVEIIRNSEAVILSYTEASQSGVIPISKALNKKILFKDTGGLGEQLLGYPNAYAYTKDNFENVWNKMLAAETVIENQIPDSWAHFFRLLESDAE
jgi:glycosyltransferase involved in cell wall biosynthesis